MKYAGFLALLLAGGAIWYVLMMNRKENFTPEFLDKRGVKKTVDTMKSSYAQETNHFKATQGEFEPVHGMETPFRVNMYNSHTV